MTASDDPIQTYLAAWLRGAPLPLALPTDDAALLLREAVDHGVVNLLADRLGEHPEAPPAFAEGLSALARHGLLSDLAREHALRQVLDRSAAEGLDLLLVKGAHLAYSHYLRADLRPRTDTDLFVAQDQRAQADSVLTALGYTVMTQVTGDLVSSQAMYVLRSHGVVIHGIDLHWRIANPQLFAEALGHEELLHRSVLLPRLGAHARGLSDVDALMLACMHRVAHHYDSPRLIWLYDIHLLASSLAPEDWPRLRALVRERSVSAVCHVGLSRAAAIFHTPLPPLLLSELARDASESPEETARYLGAPSRAVSLWQDLRHLSTWRARLRLLREHLVPSSDYMRRVYAPNRRMPLLLLYIERVCVRAVTWFRRR